MLGTVPPTAAATSPLASVKHVWVLALENENADVTFAANSPAPYLSKTLPSMGVFVPQYFGIGHVSLDNYIAMISGQAPNAITQSDCQTFADFVPPAAIIDGNGQAIGEGCVFPSGVNTVVQQLDSAGLTWRGYMEDMATPCRHPAIGTQDTTQQAKVGDQYATRHDPFMYFHSIIDDNASCQSHVVDLSALNSDLSSVATTPNFSFITPNLCHDGHDAPCVDNQPGGLVSADAFLQEWVPKILASNAFKQDGMLVVTFDEAEVGNPSSATACCGEAPGPNSPSPGVDGPGGGRVGAVVLSPFTQPGSTTTTAYNHYALLRTIEDVFALDHLGFAAASGLQPFGSDVLNAGPGADGSSTGATTRRAGAGLAATGRSTPFAVPAAAAIGALGLLILARRSRRNPGEGVLWGRGRS